MKKSVFIPATIIALITALAFGTTSFAEPSTGKGEGYGPHHMMHDGKGYGPHHMMHDGHGGHHKPAWKESLTKAQKDKLRKMKVDFLKVKYPLKARMKTIKLELAVLATADVPDQKAIDAKIDALLVLKKEMLQASYAHKIAVRKELTSEQKVLYDKHMLKKAKKGKCKGKRGHYGHHGSRDKS
jgi:Spy/CpxP family protein refolding chaperone